MLFQAAFEDSPPPSGCPLISCYFFFISVCFSVLFFSSLPSYTSLSSPFSISNVRQYAVDEQGHDSSAEEACYRDGHKPGQEDVPEKTPVHGLPGAEPAHRHHWAHLHPQQRQKSAVARYTNMKTIKGGFHFSRWN